MLTVFQSPPPHIPLTQDEFLRLVRVADLFDIHVNQFSPERVEFRIYEKTGWRTFELDSRTAVIRLMTELGSKAVRWVYFHAGEHCAKTLLSLPDKKLERIGELYQRWKSAGFPE